ncbi:MAG: phosphoglycerate mutase [Sulfuriferula sp.]
MIITLLIPDLIAPPEMRDAALDRLALPALQTLLARADQTSVTAEGGLDGWLCRAFGVTKQQDWPIAPVTLQADGGNAGNDYWLRADPVHLRATRDKLMLVDSGAFQINQAEAETYAQAFNAHFSDEGFILYPLRPDRWYLKLDRPPTLTTQPLTAVTGKHVDPYLPQGADGLKWHRLYNEIQMLFFGLPLNDAREMRGELTVNSIWLWGGGTRPQIAAARATVLANDPTARAIAFAAACPNDTVPQDAAALADSPDDTLVLLEHLRGAAQYGDIIGWREGMQQLETDWFAPLVKRLKSGKIAELRIIAPGVTENMEWRVTRSGLLKFWKRASLAGLLR